MLSSEHQKPYIAVFCDAEERTLCADDPQLAEFLQLMQPRRAGNIWSNEDAQLTQKGSRAAAAQAPPQAAGKAKSSCEAADALEKATASQHAQAAPRGRKSNVQKANASAGKDSLLSYMLSQT